MIPADSESTQREISTTRGDVFSARTSAVELRQGSLVLGGE